MVRTAQYCRAKLAPPSIPHSFMRRSCNVMSCMYSVRARRGEALFGCTSAVPLDASCGTRRTGQSENARTASSPLPSPLHSNLISFFECEMYCNRNVLHAEIQKMQQLQQEASSSPLCSPLQQCSRGDQTLRLRRPGDRRHGPRRRLSECTHIEQRAQHTMQSSIRHATLLFSCQCAGVYFVLPPLEHYSTRSSPKEVQRSRAALLSAQNSAAAASGGDMASERKAVIKNADMSEEMQQDAIDCASQALVRYAALSYPLSFFRVLILLRSPQSC